MRRYLSLLSVVFLVGLFASCEEGPEQIYKPLPDNFDPRLYNGWAGKSHINEGTNPFAWTTSGIETGTTIICQADEMAKRWADMVKKPIVPTEGAGGLDLKGQPKWSGLALDDAQQNLCQAGVYGDYLAAWGDNWELIGFFDSKTRLIYRLVTLTGYYGAIEAGGYKITNNREIMLNDKPLINATSDENLRKMNTAFLKKFRPEVKNPEQRDCVATNSCYVMDWYTLKRFVFNDLMLDFATEPEGRIDHIGLNLVRNFEFGKSPVKFSPAPAGGLLPVPMIDATSAASGCKPTLGSKWSDITGTGKCLMIDPVEKALVQAGSSNEVVSVDMGGLSLQMARPTLKADEVIPDTINKADPTDEVIAMVFGMSYEGKIMIPRDTLYSKYLVRVAARVQDLVPGVDVSTKLANIKPLGDATTLLLGTQKIEDCNESPCVEATLTKQVRKLVEEEIVAAGNTVPATIKNDPNFFTELFLRELMKLFNGDTEPGPTVIDFYPNDESAQILYVVLLRTINNQRYAVRTGYDHMSDQLFYLFFKKGGMRTEAVLFKVAEEQSTDGVFRLSKLAMSPPLGLGNTLFPDPVKSEVQKALIKVNITPQTSVLVSYLPESTLSGYVIPVEGKRDKFMPASYFGFPGNVIAAAIYADETDGIIKSIGSGSFYDKLDFCGQKVGLYDEAIPLLKSLPDTCDRIVSFSENNKFLSAVSTYVQETPFRIGLRLYFTAGRVDYARYWAEE